ncbi:thioredoxin-like protein [Infundibulicybe gibba]|nr:thioredoxin-like protein [Infundibulicybe gibba]
MNAIGYGSLCRAATLVTDRDAPPGRGPLVHKLPNSSPVGTPERSTTITYMNSLVSRSLRIVAPRPCPSLSLAKTVRLLHSTAHRSEHFLKADLQTFQKATQSKDRVALVDFYADWCSPCRQLSPILESITNDPATKSSSGLPVDLVTIDTEDEPGFELGQKFAVRALPTVIAFRDGKPIGQFVGALNEPGVRKFLEGI